MNPERFTALSSRYPGLRIGVVGDFCLDRYLEIDPEKQEISIETGLPVYNVVQVRSQPGGAGTILNNLCALGIGTIDAVGFCGEDGEGWELVRALQTKPGVRVDRFFRTPDRRTFTYTKPLLIQHGKPPVELNRLDLKNWTATPDPLVDRLSQGIWEIADQLDALILLDQVDLADTGVVTSELLCAISRIAERYPALPIVADSRRTLAGFPKVICKMNSAELARMTNSTAQTELEPIRVQAAELARSRERAVFVTLAERGIIGAAPSGESSHVPALPVRGEIDVVGAGDAVTANLAAALASGATQVEAMETAMLASSIVVHQLGTTGTASVADIQTLMAGRAERGQPF